MIVLLWLARHAAHRLRPGDLLGIFFVWYGVVRFALETLREGNWTFNGVPTAWLFAGGSVILGLAIIAYRHVKPGRPSIAETDAARIAERAAREAEAAGEPVDELEPDDSLEPDERAQRTGGDGVSTA
jgi:prolipoprotein diacylglyceryltransferase